MTQSQDRGSPPHIACFFSQEMPRNNSGWVHLDSQPSQSFLLQWASWALFYKAMKLKQCTREIRGQPLIPASRLTGLVASPQILCTCSPFWPKYPWITHASITSTWGFCSNVCPRQRHSWASHLNNTCDRFLSLTLDFLHKKPTYRLRF